MSPAGGGWVVRAARPGDADAAAALILEPAPSLRDLLGSAHAAARMARASFLSPRTLYSHRHAVVASDGAAVTGLAIGVPGDQWRRRRWWTGLVMLAAGPAWGRALARSGALVDRLTPPVPADCLYVAALAVAPAARGRGVGTALLGRLEAEARRAGRGRLALDVHRGNDAARAFYARRGFAATGGAGATPFVRLEKPLGLRTPAG